MPAPAHVGYLANQSTIMTVEYSFGEDEPSKMPQHFFCGAHRIDYATAIKADTHRQNCSICPRFWYVDAYFNCAKCGAEFCFSCIEQRTWFEEYGFWVDAFPKHCLDCRKALRKLKTLRKQYDAMVSQTIRGTDLAAKRQLAAIIDQLYEQGGALPPRIHEYRRLLAHQLGEGSGVR